MMEEESGARWVGVDVTRSFFLKPTDVTDVEYFKVQFVHLIM